MVCQCAPASGGGASCGRAACLNGMLNMECVSGYCPCGKECLNQRFQRKQYCKFEVRRAGLKGFGLFAKEDIKKGAFIVEYVGEVLDEEEYLRRKDYYHSVGQRHYYFMNIGNGEVCATKFRFCFVFFFNFWSSPGTDARNGGGPAGTRSRATICAPSVGARGRVARGGTWARAQVIDACRRGNKARFINHSCEPNCETQKWVVKGELKIGFFATRAIEAGGEVQFDYNFERYGDKPTKCHCGAATCRGFIGGSADRYAGAAVDDAGMLGEDLQPIMLTSAPPWPLLTIGPPPREAASRRCSRRLHTIRAPAAARCSVLVQPAMLRCAAAPLCSLRARGLHAAPRW